MWVQTPWGVFEVKNSFCMYNTIFLYILRVPVSMKGSKGHQKSRKQRKQTGFKELAHICVLCSAIASPSLLSSSPIRVNPNLGVTWGVYLCAGKPPLADIILSHPSDLTRCDSVIGLAIPAMSGHVQYRGAASGDLYIRISGINRALLS